MSPALLTYLNAQLCPTVEAGSSTEMVSMSSAPTIVLVPPTISAAKSASRVNVLNKNSSLIRKASLIAWENVSSSWIVPRYGDITNNFHLISNTKGKGVYDMNSDL